MKQVILGGILLLAGVVGALLFIFLPGCGDKARPRDPAAIQTATAYETMQAALYGKPWQNARARGFKYNGVVIVTKITDDFEIQKYGR